MRLLVTIEVEEPESGTAARPGTRRDIVLDYAPETRVRDLVAALTANRMAALPSNVVALPGASSVPTLTGPVDLYLGEHLVDPSLTIDASPVRPRCGARARRPFQPARGRATRARRGQDLVGPR